MSRPPNNRPPIVLRAKALDVLDQLHDDVRRRRKLRETPMRFDRIETWEREARRRFGPNKLAWKWRCHHCGTVFSAADYVHAGAPQHAVGFACLGVFEKRIPCNFTGLNPKPVNPVTVEVGDQTVRMLAFADE